MSRPPATPNGTKPLEGSTVVNPTDTLRALLDALNDDPKRFTDDQLGEVAALAQEVHKVAGHLFVARLLIRSREDDES